MTILEILIKAHSGFRWLVLLAIVVGVWGLVRGWWGAAQYQKQRRVWGIVYSVLLDVQLALGLLIFFMLSAWSSLWHPISMILAVGCAHFGTILGRQPPERAKPHWPMLAYILSYLLILFGLAFVPRGFGF